MQGGKRETTRFQSLLQNTHKIQVPIIRGWDFSLLWHAGKQFKPLNSQMMEYHNYTLFIGHLIPAMTDAAPKTPKCFHLHFHVAKQAEGPQIA